MRLSVFVRDSLALHTVNGYKQGIRVRRAASTNGCFAILSKSPINRALKTREMRPRGPTSILPRERDASRMERDVREIRQPPPGCSERNLGG